MAFWVPYSDFKIGVEKKDIEEYLRKIRANELPITPQKKNATHAPEDSQQQSFAYFIREKMGLPYYQNASIEIGFKDIGAARRYLVMSEDKAPAEYKDKIAPEDAIDLSGMDFSEIDLEGVTFNSTDLRDVDFDKASLYNSSISNTDLSASDSITKAFTNTNTTFSEGVLSEEKEEFIRRKVHSEGLATGTSPDDAKVIESLGDLGAATKALRLGQVFVGTLMPGSSVDDYIISTEQAFNILRYQSLKRKDPSLLDQVENFSKKHIKAEVESALRDVNFTLSTWISWAGLSSPDKYSKHLEKVISDSLVDEISKDDFLKKHFSAGDDDLRSVLREKILTEHFVKMAQSAVKALSTHEVPVLKESTPKRVESHVREEIRKWKEHHVEKSKWKELESLSKRKKFKSHVGISPAAGNLFTRQLPDWCSPLKPSSYAAIDPYDKEAVIRDLDLKREGAEFLKKIGALGTGTAVTTFMTAFAPTGYTTSAITGVLAGTLTSIASERFIEKEFKYENHKNFDNKLGDKLLELGIIYRSMKPHIGTLGIGGVQSILIGCMQTSGYLQEALSKYQKVLSSVSTYAAYNDFYATRQYLEDQTNKNNPQNRRRPSSESFELNLKHKLFNHTRFFTSIAVGAALLISGLVISTIFPGAIPALALFASKASAWQVGIAATTAFAVTYEISSLAYGAIAKSVDHMKNLVKRKSHKTKFSTQADEDLKAKEKAANVIKSAFSNYKHRKTDKFRKIAEEVKEKRKDPEYLAKLTQAQHKDEAVEALKGEGSTTPAETSKKHAHSRKSHKDRLLDNQAGEKTKKRRR